MTDIGELTRAWPTTRTAFESASAWFVRTVSAITEGFGDLGSPALGEWTVRDLLGHTSRALSTVETYVAVGSHTESVRDTAGYFQALRTSRADPAAVAERGRQAGRDLGDEPFATVSALATRVRALVAGCAATTRVDTPAGEMVLAAYLPTRVFELTVHTADLCLAVGIPAEPPRPAAVEALRVAGLLLAGLPSGSEAGALLALTGRGSLPDGFSIL